MKVGDIGILQNMRSGDRVPNGILVCLKEFIPSGGVYRNSEYKKKRGLTDAYIITAYGYPSPRPHGKWVVRAERIRPLPDPDQTEQQTEKEVEA